MTQALWLILALILTGFSPQAETTSEATRQEILRRLRSDDPRDVAWGAYEAASRQLPGLGPELNDLLAALQKRSEWEWYQAEQAVLDAMIRLGVQARGPALNYMHLSSPSTLSAAELVLFAQSADGDEDLLGCLLYKYLARGEPVGVTGLVIGNLLCELWDSEFALWLLPRGPVPIKVHVLGPGESSSDLICPGGGWGGIGRGPIPPGFPPYAHFEVRSGPPEGDGWELLANGPRPIYFRRSELTEGTTGRLALPCIRFDSQKVAAEWLSALSGVGRADANFPLSLSIKLVWDGPEHAVQRIAAARDDLLEHYWRVVSGLVSQGVLTRDQARALHLEFKLQITGRNDLWDRASPQLPSPTPPPDFHPPTDHK